MILNTIISIAFKNVYGEYVTKEMSIFEMDKVGNIISNLDIKFNKNHEITLKFKCQLCDMWHYYDYNLNELMKKDMIIFGCESYGGPSLIIGNTEKVKKFVSTYRDVNRKVYAMM